MVTTSRPAEWEAVGLAGESKLVLCTCGFWTYKSLHPHGVRYVGGRLVDCMGRDVAQNFPGAPRSSNGDTQGNEG